MIKVIEISYDEVLKTSDGEIIKTLASPVAEYAAIYDDKKISDSDVKTYLKCPGALEDRHPNIVIMDKSEWEKLHEMIVNNYVMSKKGDVEGG